MSGYFLSKSADFVPGFEVLKSVFPEDCMPLALPRLFFIRAAFGRSSVLHRVFIERKAPRQKQEKAVPAVLIVFLRY